MSIIKICDICGKRVNDDNDAEFCYGLVYKTKLMYRDIDTCFYCRKKLTEFVEELKNDYSERNM